MPAPWLSKNDYVPTDKVHSDMFNSLANDDRQWGGNVNGGGYTLSNVTIAGLLTDPTQIKGDLIVRGAASLTRLAVSATNGHVLTVDDQATTGMKWAAPTGGGGGIPPNDTSTQRIRASLNGGLIATRQEMNFTNTASVTFSVVEEPLNNRVTVSATSTGGAGGMADPTTAKGDLLVRNGPIPTGSVTRLPVGATNGFVLTVDSSQAVGVKWAAATGGGFADPTTAKGDLIVRGNAAPPTNLPSSNVNGQVLTVDTSATLGLKWAAPPATGVPTTRLLTAGTGLSGGGDLSADRSFAVVDKTSIQKINFLKAGTVAGTQPGLNFIAGSGVDVSVSNDNVKEWVQVTISSTGTGGGGMGDPTVNVGDMIVRGIGGIEAIPVGTNGQVLTADSTDSKGIKWKPVATGGQNQTPWLTDIDGGGKTLNNAQINAKHPLNIVADAGGNCQLALRVGGANRWSFMDTANAAADLNIGRYNDAGSFLDSPITVTRATGVIALNHDVNVTGAVAVTGNVQAGGTVSATSVNITGSYFINGVPISTSQTPWTSSINAAGFDLWNCSGILISDPTYTLQNTPQGFSFFKGNRRWYFYDSGAEGGSNSGSDFYLDRYNDAGSNLGNAIAVTRATGDFRIGEGGGNFSLGPAVRASVISVPSDGAADSGALVFSTRSLGTLAERMRVSAAGNVGIGTTDPSTARLYVNGGRSVFQTGSGTDVYTIGLVNATAGSGFTSFLTCDTSGSFGVSDAVGNIRMRVTQAGLFGCGPYIGSIVNAMPFHVVANNAADPAISGTAQPGGLMRMQAYDIGLDFGVYAGATIWMQGYGSVSTNLANIQHLAIQPRGGNVAIGKQSASYKLDVVGDINITGQYYINGIIGATMRVQVNSVHVGTRPTITFNNGASSTAFGADDAGNNRISAGFNFVSDIRMKRNIADLEGGLAVIERLRPVSFEHNGALGHPEGKKNISIITQELEKVLPDCVYPIRQKLFPEDEEEADLLAYDPQHILYHLVLAVKQLAKKIGEKQ